MKNEKSIKTTRTTLTIIAIAIAVTVIALTTALLPNRATAQAAADKNAKSSQIEQTINQIDVLEAEYQKLFDERADLWEKYFAELQKLDELPDDFDEKAFIDGLETLTADEKASLLNKVTALDELDAKLEKLYDELFDKDEDVLYNGCKDDCCDFAETDADYFADNGSDDCDISFVETDENFFGENFTKACEEAELENDNIQALKKEFDELVELRAELWDKVYASYDELPDDFDYADFDEAKHIENLTVLTAEEKEILLGDLVKLNEISQKLYGICGANCGRW